MCECSSMMPQVKSVLAKAETTIEDGRKNIVEITAKANEIAGKTNDLLESLDERRFTVRETGDRIEPSRTEALQWTIERGSRSGRVAWQFIQEVAGELGKKLD